MKHSDEDFICIYCDSPETMPMTNGLLYCTVCGRYFDIDDGEYEKKEDIIKLPKGKDGDIL